MDEPKPFEIFQPPRKSLLSKKSSKQVFYGSKPFFTVFIVLGIISERVLRTAIWALKVAWQLCQLLWALVRGAYELGYSWWCWWEWHWWDQVYPLQSLPNAVELYSATLCFPSINCLNWHSLALNDLVVAWQGVPLFSTAFPTPVFPSFVKLT